MKAKNYLVTGTIVGILGFFYGLSELIVGTGGGEYKISIANGVWYIVFDYMNSSMNTYLAIDLISYFVLFFVFGLIIVWIYDKIKSRVTTMK